MPAESTLATVVAQLDEVLARSMAQLARELRVLIRELDTKDGKFLKDQAKGKLAIAEQVITLTANHAGQASRELLQRLSGIVAETLADHPELGKYTPSISSNLLAVARFGSAELALAIADDGSREILDAIQDVVVSGQSIEQASPAIAQALQTTRTRAITAVDRAVREFHETVIKEMGKDSGEEFVYLYVGPGEESPNIRPYCRARVGRVLSQDQADALDPRERFNCRHSLAPILKSDADERGLERFKG